MQRRNKSAELEGNKIQVENKNKIQPLHHISNHLLLAQVLSNYEGVRRTYQHAQAQFSPPHPLRGGNIKKIRSQNSETWIY